MKCHVCTNHVESLKSVGDNFHGLLKSYRFVGMLLCVFSYTNIKYYFITLIYDFVEDVNLRMRGTHEI